MKKKFGQEVWYIRRKKSKWEYREKIIIQPWYLLYQYLLESWIIGDSAKYNYLSLDINRFFLIHPSKYFWNTHRSCNVESTLSKFGTQLLNHRTHPSGNSVKSKFPPNIRYYVSTIILCGCQWSNKNLQYSEITISDYCI